MTSSASNDRVLVLGLGNWLMSDDGIGVHAVRALAEDPPAGADLVDAGTAVLDALPLVEAADRVLLLDAVTAGGPPGTVCTFDARDATAARPALSLHSLDLPSALACFGRGPGPREIRVLGVEPARIGYGTELSTAVRAALPALTSAARRIIAAWTTGKARGNAEDAT